ncbi:translation initiation factor IF-2-like [Dermochelys coriacea]|uniref:translation initiation factor IF-2-like n=1 Tax=Dermochelys coriacea TaxID=27794 RepID=UPI001CA99C3F|nr:translation initiation factor IF-2-like [Dermochelys coriacea]
MGGRAQSPPQAAGGPRGWDISPPLEPMQPRWEAARRPQRRPSGGEEGVGPAPAASSGARPPPLLSRDPSPAGSGPAPRDRTGRGYLTPRPPRVTHKTLPPSTEILQPRPQPGAAPRRLAGGAGREERARGPGTTDASPQETQRGAARPCPGGREGRKDESGGARPRTARREPSTPSGPCDERAGQRVRSKLRARRRLERDAACAARASGCRSVAARVQRPEPLSCIASPAAGRLQAPGGGEAPGPSPQRSPAGRGGPREPAQHRARPGQGVRVPGSRRRRRPSRACPTCAAGWLPVCRRARVLAGREVLAVPRLQRPPALLRVQPESGRRLPPPSAAAKGKPSGPPPRPRRPWAAARLTPGGGSTGTNDSGAAPREPLQPLAQQRLVRRQSGDPLSPSSQLERTLSRSNAQENSFQRLTRL